MPPAIVAANKACVSGGGPGRPNSKTYPYRGVQMSTDPEFMRWEMRLLIRRHGLKGGDMWFDALHGRGFDLPLPFSAHTRGYGGLRPRSPLDVQREMQDDPARAEIGPAAVALAKTIYPEVRQEAVDCLNGFQEAMRATLETALVESERRLETQRILYGVKRTSEGPGGAFEAKNTVAFQGLVGAAKDLLAIRNRITSLRQQQMELMVSRGKGGSVVPESNKPRYDALQLKIDVIEKEYDTARAGAALRYPVLGAILDDSSREFAGYELERLARGELTSPARGHMSPPAGTAAMIGNVLEQRQSSIDTVREKVDSDPDKLWSIAPIVSLTRSVLDTRNKVMADKLVDEKLEDRAFDETIKQLFLGVLALVLALPTGGGSLAVGAAVAGAALSGYQALKSISRYQLEMALTSTDLEKRAYAISTEEPSAFWVALDVVFFVADAAQALNAVRALRGPARDALLAKEGAEALQTAEKLEKAADSVEGLSKPGLGKRLLDQLGKLRKQPTAARVLGEVGETEAKAVVRSGEAIAKEAADAERIVSVLGHDVKVTRSGHIVICTECTWLRERFARELADSPELLKRLKLAEETALTGALDTTAKAEVAALATELEQAQKARVLAELGPEGVKAAEEAAKAGQATGKGLPKELEDAAGLAPRAPTKDAPLKPGESIPYKEGTIKGRGTKGDLLTPDHIPSRAALVQAKQEKVWADEAARLDRPLTPAEKEALRLTQAEKDVMRDEAQAIVKGEKFHAERSRTYAGRNKAEQIAEDAKDLAIAVEKDFVADLSALQKSGDLTRAKVAEYIQHYKNLADKGAIPYSERINSVLLDFLKKAK
jgi:hypothetical protein